MSTAELLKENEEGAVLMDLKGKIGLLGLFCTVEVKTHFPPKYSISMTLMILYNRRKISINNDIKQGDNVPGITSTNSFNSGIFSARSIL